MERFVKLEWKMKPPEEKAERSNSTKEMLNIIKKAKGYKRMKENEKSKERPEADSRVKKEKKFRKDLEKSERVWNIW